jgi:dTDP-4-dehydrorhamnose reductase
MRMLITGAAGMLGSELVPAMAAAGHELVVTDINLTEPRPWGPNGPTLCLLDVRNRDHVSDALDAVHPHIVLHLAAETSLEASETDPDHAFLTNAIGTKWVALGCARRGLPMVYISTAGVFDGTKPTPYTEFDEPNPINVYGHSKLEGEHFVRTFVGHHFIVRAGWMVGGGSKKDHKFVSRILAQINAGYTSVFAVGDKYGTPTYARDFSKCLRTLIHSGSYGLYHMACGGHGNRHDVAERILEVLGRDDVQLVEVSSDFFREEFFAPRPASESMRNLVLDLQGMNKMRPWQDAIEDYMLTCFPNLVSKRRVASR